MDLLGYEVKDKVSGLTGVAFEYVKFITGCDQYMIQPAAKEDGTMPRNSLIDFTRLEKTKEDRAMEPINVDLSEVDVDDAIMGHDAQDTVSKFKGVIVGLSVSISGVISVGISPVVDEKNEGKNSLWFELDRVEVTPKEDRFVHDKEEDKGGPNIDAPTKENRIK